VLPMCAEEVMVMGITLSICTTGSQITYFYVQGTLLLLHVIATSLCYREQSKIDIIACKNEARMAAGQNGILESVLEGLEHSPAAWRT